MAGPVGRVVSSGVPVGPRSVDSFLEAKLNRPSVRSDWVGRRRLIDQLETALQRPLVLVAAPAGFGKTTLVAQWLTTEQSRTIAWVSLDAGDNDPVRFWTHVAIALERAGIGLGDDAAAFVASRSGEIDTSVLPPLIDSMAASAEEIVLLLDDFHFVQERACHAEVEFLIEHLPANAHILITTRFDPGLRLGRLRASGRVGEIRAGDLAFDLAEATSLLALDDIHLSSHSVEQLMQRTEGWPVGLYLAVLSLAGREDPDEFVRQFTGDNRFVGDYMSEEVLSKQTDETRRFITDVSILDRVSASLCDYVTDTTGSSATLRQLERRNMFLVPLDQHHLWYRFHPLFATAARNELEIEHPDRLPTLHRRAAEWFRQRDHIDEAVQHLVAAGDLAEAAVLVQANVLKYIGAGRTATVTGWLGSLGPSEVADDPSAAVTAAWMAALLGDEASLSAHLEVLERFPDHGPLPDGARSVESASAMIQGLFGFGGPGEMTAAAVRAVKLETDAQSPYYALSRLALGHAAYVAGDLGLADEMLAAATQSEAALPMVRILSLSVYSLVRGETGHPQHARELAVQAMQVVVAGNLQGVPQASLAFTALGRVHTAEGRLVEAVAVVDQGLRVRRRHPKLAPWPTMHHLLVAAELAIVLGDLDDARELLEETRALMDRFSEGMEAMRARLAAVRRRFPVTVVHLSGEPLTERELEVLRLLTGTLSLTQIAAELFVSHNTVKSHTRAVYRKLGATSRADAVLIARERLLL